MEDQIFERTCSKCGTTKALDEFAVRNGEGVRYRQCKGCRAAVIRSWKVANPAKVEAARDRERAKTGAQKKTHLNIPDGYKRCSRCGEVEPLGNFPQGSGSKKKYGYCRECRFIYYRENKVHVAALASKAIQRRKEKDWVAYKYQRMGYSAKRRRMAVLFTLEEFRLWYSQQSPQCSYCRLTKDQLEELKISFSIDRCDSARPYSLDNIVLACLCCNKIKLDVLTVEDMWQIGGVIRRRLLSRLQNLAA